MNYIKKMALGMALVVGLSCGAFAQNWGRHEGYAPRGVYHAPYAYRNGWGYAPYRAWGGGYYPYRTYGYYPSGNWVPYGYYPYRSYYSGPWAYYPYGHYVWRNGLRVWVP